MDLAHPMPTLIVDTMSSDTVMALWTEVVTSARHSFASELAAAFAVLFIRLVHLVLVLYPAQIMIVVDLPVQFPISESRDMTSFSSYRLSGAQQFHGVALMIMLL